MNDSNILIISSIIRISATYLVLYFLHIPSYLKVILFWFIDLIDCDIPRLLNLYKNKKFCDTTEYQITDKITDSLCYIMLLNYIFQNNLLNKKEINVIFWLLLYRLIGVLIFLKKKNRQILFYFPNFFLEITLALLFIKESNIKNLTNYKTIIIGIVLILKIIQEYILHYNK